MVKFLVEIVQWYYASTLGDLELYNYQNLLKT